MADKSLYGRLKRLFNNNVIVRRVGKSALRVIDNDHLQSLGNAHNSKFVDRFTRLHGVRPHSMNTYNPNYNYFSSKTELYTDYEVMDQDSIIASALDIYADETVMKDDFGDVLRITSDNENIKKILHNLFYDVLNIEFNLWPWVRNMCKYGDLYLRLDVHDEIGIVNVVPMSAYEIIREEGVALDNPYHVQFKQLGGGNIIYENFEIAHFRLLNDSNFLPYGKSMIEPARKVWKQLTLMEDAMLIHRIMRAPEKRIFKIDVGNIPPNEIDNYMQRIINQMRKTPYVDPQTGDYNLKFNMQNMLEDYFLPVRGGQSGTEIDTLSGMEFTGIDDLEYLRNKMMAALKVPKAFLGYEEGLCIAPDTLIPLMSGEEKTVLQLIEDYENGIKNYVYSIDEESKLIVPGEIEWAGFTRMNAKIVRVHLDNGKYIDCTPDHNFLTRDGEWIEAQNLVADQSLMPLYTRLSTNKNISGYTEVYHPGTGKWEMVHRLVSNYYDKFDIDRYSFVDVHMPLAKVNKGFINNFKGEYANHKVVNVEFLSEQIDTCDLTITKYHNFATSAGVIIHNSGKATLAAEDVRFARTIERIQRIVISELHKIAIVHLFSQGFKDAELIDFELTMTSPSTIYEQEKLTLYNTKVDLAKSMVEGKIMSKEWIYKNIFNFTDSDATAIELGLIEDAKESFRLTKINDEGEDPAAKEEKPKEEGGEGDETEEKGEEKDKEEKEGGNPFESVNKTLMKKYDSEAKSKRTPEGGWPGAGRPKEGVKYNTHEHPRGYDPIGRVAWKNARNESVSDVINKYGLQKFTKKSKKIISENSSLLDESNLIED